MALDTGAEASAGDAVLHLVPPNGGGVDRFVRDLVARRRHDVIVHVTPDQWVLERPAARAFAPLAPPDAVTLLRQGALGRRLRVHAHSTTAPIRQACRELADLLQQAPVLTLHDIWFDDPEQPVDERQARLAFVRAAAALTAPSAFIVERLALALQPPPACAVVPNGASPPDVAAAPPLQPPPAALQPALQDGRGFAVAVIGALGQHKGLRALEAVVAALPDEVRGVVFGYTEHHLQPGWAVPGKLWVHGPFDPSQLPALVERYQPRLAFFPPGMPESFGYALTDAWVAGLPVLVPDHGALGERVRWHGGGEVYPPDLDPVALAQRLCQQVRPPYPPLHLRHPLPGAGDMIAAMNAVYESLPDGAGLPPVDAALTVQAQQQLDGRFFRLELLHLQAHLDAVRAHAQGLEGQLLERDRTAADLQARLLALQAQLDEQAQAHAQSIERERALERERVLAAAAPPPAPPSTGPAPGRLRRWLARLLNGPAH